VLRPSAKDWAAACRGSKKKKAAGSFCRLFLFSAFSFFVFLFFGLSFL
jgi:hypothetical protein